jgi:hypothetical protein
MYASLETAWQQQAVERAEESHAPARPHMDEINHREIRAEEAGGTACATFALCRGHILATLCRSRSSASSGSGRLAATGADRARAWKLWAVQGNKKFGP